MKVFLGLEWVGGPHTANKWALWMRRAREALCLGLALRGGFAAVGGLAAGSFGGGWLASREPAKEYNGS